MLLNYSYYIIILVLCDHIFVLVIVQRSLWKHPACNDVTS